MKLKVRLDEGAYKPLREHRTDAGLDLRAMETVTVFPRSSAVCRTGVHVQLPKGTAGILISKSGLNVKNNITSTGLIDQGYTGEILVKLYNHGETHYKVNAGDKISQLVIVPVYFPHVWIVDEINGGTRGDAGFGSTGR